MKSDIQRKDTKTFTFNPNGAIILFSMTWVVIEFAWRLPFVRGDVGGIYWFLYCFEKLSSPLATLGLVTTLLLFVIAIVIRATKWGHYSNITRAASALFLATLIIGISTFRLFEPTETRHLDAIKIHGGLYYLTAYSAFDTNYALYDCDSKGIFCKQVYLSNDFMPGWFYAKLVYYPASNEVAIEVKNEGVIYRYKLPPIKL